MIKKTLKKLVNRSSKGEQSESFASKIPSQKILTVAGWKRLMMKKYRKSS